MRKLAVRREEVPALGSPRVGCGAQCHGGHVREPRAVTDLVGEAVTALERGVGHIGKFAIPS
jgi:hypothetical protein